MIDIDTYSGGYVYNGGTIAQVLGAAANSGDTVISFDNGLASSFVDNLASGKIYGDIYLGNGQGVYLANAGQIFGNISFGNRQGDYVSNTGQIFGNVLLGAGQGDAYYGAQGKLSGTIVCGGYNDTVFTGADFETVVAGVGNDTFYMATGGETIISETLAQQRLDGWDVVSNFQSYNPATRQGTFLQIDPALAASTFFVAYGGGTLVEMALGGGNYAFVDVLGASVAAVQGQTYFA
jgi:hypothetical protein